MLIDKDFLDGIEGYGTFYIFHRNDKFSSNNFIVINRCYLGFSFNDNLSSFVHGNGVVRFQSFDGKYVSSNMVKNTLLQNTYRIQNSFEGFTKSELFFVNPTSKKLNFSIGNNKYSLEKYCSTLINISDINEVFIMTRCMFFRPIIFNYKHDFIDVYHS